MSWGIIEKKAERQGRTTPVPRPTSSPAPAHAGRRGLPIAPFLAASAAARLVRFAVVSLLAVAAAGRLRRAGVGESALRGWHAAVWTVFYAAFFSLMPG
jgi:hypothetical protein